DDDTSVTSVAFSATRLAVTHFWAAMYSIAGQKILTEYERHTSMNDLSSYWPQITRYVSGEASANERAALELWASERREHQALLDQAVRLWGARSAVAVTAPEEIERQFARLSARIGGASPT